MDSKAELRKPPSWYTVKAPDMHAHVKSFPSLKVVRYQQTFSYFYTDVARQSYFRFQIQCGREQPSEYK